LTLRKELLLKPLNEQAVWLIGDYVLEKPFLSILRQRALGIALTGIELKY
jgi:hypothetical protein